MVYFVSRSSNPYLSVGIDFGWKLENSIIWAMILLQTTPTAKNIDLPISMPFLLIFTVLLFIIFVLY